MIIDIACMVFFAFFYSLIIKNVPYQWMNLGGNVYYMQSLLSTFLGVLMMTLCAVIIERTQILDEFIEEYGKESMTILVLHGLDILMLRNWAMRDWAFVGVTILGYSFLVYLKKRVYQQALWKQL